MKKSKYPDECLSKNLFKNLAQAKDVIEEFYNTQGPHSGLGGKALIWRSLKMRKYDVTKFGCIASSLIFLYLYHFKK